LKEGVKATIGRAGCDNRTSTDRNAVCVDEKLVPKQPTRILILEVVLQGNVAE